MGNTLDVKKQTLYLNPKTLDNFFRPGRLYGWEKYDDVRVRLKLPNEYSPLIFKELFALVKQNGILSITYPLSTRFIDDAIEKEFWWLFKKAYTIISHEKSKNNATFTIKKENSMLATTGSINDWTFGIVTNGDRDEWLKEIIDSIKKQNIPHYEIIICGQTQIRISKNIRYLFFDERTTRGWITRKKNYIASQARYENICIIHDRVVFDKKWYQGMKQYGNMFELLGCVQKVRDTRERAGDWITINGPHAPVWNGLYLHYRDWDKYVYLSGQLTIIKKKIWEKILWDESRYWNEFEDIDLSHRAMSEGYLTRFNPYSTAYALIWRHGRLPQKYRRSEGFFPKDDYYTRVIRIIGRIIYATPIVNIYIPQLGRKIMQTAVFKRTKRTLLPHSAQV